MDDFEEETIIGVVGKEIQGPVTRITLKPPFVFTITFGSNTEWLKNSTKIVHDKYKTIGEANRGWLHEVLNRQIDKFMENNSFSGVT